MTQNTDQASNPDENASSNPDTQQYVDGGKLAFTAIFFTVLIDIIGFGIIIPVMPAMIADVTGLSHAEAAPYGGILLTVFALIQFVSSPIIGGLSDRFGRRPIILLSLLGYAIDFLIMGLAKIYLVLFIGRVFSGAFAATYATANAYIADSTPPDKRPMRFGMLGAAFGIGFIIGPGIGGIIGDQFGPRAPFFAASALAFINFVYSFFVLPETLAPEKRRKFDIKRANPVGNLLQLRKYPVMLPILIASLLMQLAHFALQSTWSWYGIEKFSWTPAQIGYSLMAVGISAAIVEGGLIRLILPRIGERRAVVMGVSITAVTYLAYAFVSMEWMIYFIIAFGALAGILRPALQGIMTRTIPDDAQGELQGAIASMMSLAMIFGPLIMTSVFSAFTVESAPVYFPGAAFLLGFLLVLISAIPMAMAFKRIAKPREETAPGPPASG